MAQIELTAEPEVRRMDWDKLIARACRHYNKRQRERQLLRGDCDAGTASADDDPEFLERIAVNYLRHQVSGYESYLERFGGTAIKVGEAAWFAAYMAIKRKILDAIAKAYPRLAGECRRQRHVRGALAPVR